MKANLPLLGTVLSLYHNHSLGITEPQHTLAQHSNTAETYVYEASPHACTKNKSTLLPSLCKFPHTRARAHTYYMLFN